MRADIRTRVAVALVVVILAACLLAGQAVADSLAPADESADTGRTLGRAGFAYLTGVRTYAAAVLWNRLDPLFHDYYDGVALQDQTFMLPSIRAVVALDPEFDQPYYVAAWLLASRGAVPEAVELSELGVINNPDSGLLIVNHAQILFLFTDRAQEAADFAKSALAPATHWNDLPDQYESYATIRSILAANGDSVLAAQVSTEMDRIDDEIESRGIVRDQHGD